GRRPVGIVSMCEDLVGDRLIEQRERDQHLVGYLSQAARALNTVSTRRQELLLAGRMQASLLPESVPLVNGWQLAAYWRPARETSGDFYDFIEFPDGRIGLVLADVTDKGMGAALYMALSRTLLRTYATEYLMRPDMVLRMVNQRILADTHGGLFITLFYGVLDPANGMLVYCNAGHHPPFMVRAEPEASTDLLTRTGIPLGVNEDATWESREVHIHPGDLLLLYSDGVIEAQNVDKELFGEGRVLDIIRAYLSRQARDVEEALLSGVRDFAGDAPQFDDITLMVIKRDP
ncbi:MAG: PP2C family protein-serine/threonine phosphatase, partial [Anaerolineales bacterium]|nr:PP2C family protein-serine/threonine phosphatase [Anaerolineales bacterium]